MKKQVARLIIVTLVLFGAWQPLAPAGRAMPPPPGCVWLGSADANWGNAANWNCGHVPTLTDDVTIWNLTGAHSPVLAGTGAAAKLFLDQLAWLRFDPDAQLVVQSGVTFNPQSQLSPGDGTLVLNNGNWTNNGGIFDAPAQSTVVFNGYGDQEINGSVTTQGFGNVTVNNMSMSMPGVLVGGSTKTVNIGGTLTINQDAMFNSGGATGLNLGGDLINNGGGFHGSRALRTTFNGSGPQVIGGTAAILAFPGSLTVDKSGGAVTLGGNISQVTVNGSLEVLGGTLRLGSGTLTVNGPTAIQKAGVFDLGSGTWNANACTLIATGGTFNPGSGTVNFYGAEWANYGGTVGTGNWTANFYPNPSQTIGGSAATQQFHNFGVYNNTMGPAGVMVSGGTLTVGFTGNVVIGDSAAFDAGTASILDVGGDWQNDGQFKPRGGAVRMNRLGPPETAVWDLSAPGSGAAVRHGGAPPLGPVAVQTIGGAQPTTFHDLTIANPGGVTLASSQRVSGTLNLQGGDLTTDVATLFLEPPAVVVGTHEVIGTVQRTQPFVPGTPYRFNHVNTSIVFSSPSPTATKGTIAVTLLKAAPAGLAPALARTYAIMAPAGTYSATLRLPYQDTELGGIAEADLRLWQRGTERWETQGPQIVNAAENWVEQSGITAFSTWALAPVNASQGRRVYLPLVLRN